MIPVNGMKIVRKPLTKSRNICQTYQFCASNTRKTIIHYLAIHERSMSCVLGQHDETRRKERAIYYFNKKFTDYESRYPSVEKIMLSPIVDYQKTEAVHAMLYHMVDHKSRFYQLHLRKAFSFRKDRKMASSTI